MGMWDSGLNAVTSGTNQIIASGVSRVEADATKIMEVADSMKWTAGTFASNGITLIDKTADTIIGEGRDLISGGIDLIGGGIETITDMVPSSFKALTGGIFNSSTQKALNDFGNTLGKDLVSLGTGKIGASDISKALGLSGKGLGEASATNASNLSPYAVTLVSQQGTGTVAFKVMPTISENRDAQYDEVDIAHHPGAIVKYAKTGNRNWAISQARLISRTVEEATENQRILNLLRSWLMPYYGYGTEAEQPQLLGAPPDILQFSAYGGKNIANIPVVLVSLNFSWPNDIDYIYTSDKQPFPVILTLEISLKEAWSPREFSGFSLNNYRNGDMSAAYNPALGAPNVVTKSEDMPKATPKTAFGETTKAEAIAAEKKSQATEPLATVKALSKSATAPIGFAKNAVKTSTNAALDMGLNIGTDTGLNAQLEKAKTYRPVYDDIPNINEMASNAAKPVVKKPVRFM